MSTEAERDARAALDDYFDRWNAADLDGMRRTLNYPFVTLGPAGQVIVANGPEEFTTDFARLREVEGWRHSTLDSLTVIQSSETKVHCDVGFSRYKADGTVYASGRVLYVMTRKDGHWGMQCRSGMPLPPRR